MKYLSILLLWMVILTGTWIDMGQDFFGPTQELREISKSNLTRNVEREPSYAKTENPALVKAREALSKGEIKNAVMEYEAALSNKTWAHSNPKKWAENVRTLITITEPSLAYELLSSFLGQGSVPENLRETAGAWRLHAREWANSDANRNPTQNISDARALITRADELQAKDPNRPVGIVLYAHSAALLNTVIADQDKNQEVFLLAGRAAEGLKDREDLVNYYQKCVSLDPNSEIGQTCQQRLQASQPLTAKHLIEESAD